MHHTATVLVFTPSGRVQLQDERERVLWDSTSSPAFRNEFGEQASPDQDAAILDWMEGQRLIDAQIAARLEIVVDSLEPDDSQDDDDEDEEGDPPEDFDDDDEPEDDE